MQKPSPSLFAISMLALLSSLAACGTGGDDRASAPADAMSLDQIAEAYVKLALALRPYDADYVDAYFGPEEWAAEAEARTAPLAELRAEAGRLLDALNAAADAGADEIVRLRTGLLQKRLGSMRLRMDMAEGLRLPFDRESETLFDAVAPDHDAAYFESVLARIETLVPGDGPLSERVDAFRRQFVVPEDRLQAVFQAAIDECRRRTLQHIELPDGESFTIEYVTDQPWSGYNWYKGHYFSLIQINTDLPIYIDRAVDLGCHEGYPGHHTYNALIEQKLVEARGWIEFTLNPLYGPQSLISEGSANYGIELAFPGDERNDFEKRVLFPLAGLDANQADRFYALLDALDELDYAGNEAARDYLNGDIDARQAAAWLVDYTLSTPERAAQRVRFFDSYRSYVINYNLGRDLVRGFIERRAGDDGARRWAEFERLLSRPMTPSDLR